MAGTSSQPMAELLCRPDQPPIPETLRTPTDKTVAQETTPQITEGPLQPGLEWSELQQNTGPSWKPGTRGRADDWPSTRPKGGAVCVKRARTELCGGSGATRFPTAIQVQRHQDPAAIRRRPRLDPQSFQPGMSSLQPRELQTQSLGRLGRVASTCSLRALDRWFHWSHPGSLTMPIEIIPSTFSYNSRL